MSKRGLVLIVVGVLQIAHVCAQFELGFNPYLYLSNGCVRSPIKTRMFAPVGAMGSSFASQGSAFFINPALTVSDSLGGMKVYSESGMLRSAAVGYMPMEEKGQFYAVGVGKHISRNLFLGLSLVNERPIFGTPGLSMASPYSVYWDPGNRNDFVPKVEVSGGVRIPRNWAFGFNATWNSMGAESITINRHALDGWGPLNHTESSDFSFDLFLNKSYGENDSTRSNLTFSCVGLNSLTRIDFADYFDWYHWGTARPYAVAYYPIQLGLAFSPRPSFIGGTGLRWHFQFQKELYVAPFTGFHQGNQSIMNRGVWNFDKLDAADADFAWSFTTGMELLVTPRVAFRSRFTLGRGVDQRVEWDEGSDHIMVFEPVSRRDRIVAEVALYEVSFGNSIRWTSQYLNLELGVAVVPPFGVAIDSDADGLMNHARVPITQFGLSLTHSFNSEGDVRIYPWNSIAEVLKGTGKKPQVSVNADRESRIARRSERRELRLEQEIAKDNAIVVERDKVEPNASDIRLTLADNGIQVERIAIVPLERKSCDGDASTPTALASYAESRLLEAYDVVERRHFEAILDEQRLALSGILFENSAVEAGCNLGAQGVVFVESQCLFGDETLNLKLVDCTTSQIQWSATGSAEAVADFFNQLVYQLQLSRE